MEWIAPHHLKRGLDASSTNRTVWLFWLLGQEKSVYYSVATSEATARGSGSLVAVSFNHKPVRVPGCCCFLPVGVLSPCPAHGNPLCSANRIHVQSFVVPTEACPTQQIEMDPMRLHKALACMSGLHARLESRFVDAAPPHVHVTAPLCPSNWMSMSDAYSGQEMWKSEDWAAQDIWGKELAGVCGPVQTCACDRYREWVVD